jgi:hypothetical protein
MTMRRLPDGRYTESVDAYHEAWDALAAPLATLGWVLSSYDPGLVLHDEQGHIVALKVHQAQRIGDALRRSEQDLRDALRQSDAWRASTARHWRLREDFEQELGLTPAVAAEDSVAQGLAAIRGLKDEVERLRARVAELEHPRSYLPPGVERAEAVFAASVLAIEQERDTWRARAEFAERELSQAFGLPGTIGPAPGEAARIVQRLRGERAVLRARLVGCRSWVGVCPWPGAPAWSEVIAQRELADDTLEEIKP